MRERRTGGVLSKGVVLLALILAVFIACENPTGPSTGGGASGNPGGGAGGGSGDVPPSPITITFVLDVDAGGELGALTTSATAPPPLAATAGVPVRLNQGIGFTAAVDGGGGQMLFHASGWSTDSLAAQFTKLSSGTGPTGAGYYLPTYEATFAADTTLYVRWIPDSFAVRLEYRNPADSSQTVLGPVLFGGDSVVLETWGQFQERLSPSWNIAAGHEVFKWRRAEMIPSVSSGWDPHFIQDVGEFVPLANRSGMPTAMQVLPVEYDSRMMHTVAFNYNGATGNNGVASRRAFDDLRLADQPSWTEWDFIKPIRGGLDFAGWFNAPTGGTQFANVSGNAWTNPGGASSVDPLKVNSDMTLNARWQANVTFVPNGGTVQSGTLSPQVFVDVTGPTDVAVPGLNPQYGGPSADRFAGWYSDAALTTLVSADPDADIAVSEHITLYAGWRSAYTVGDPGPAGGTIFYVAGGSAVGSTVARDWRFLEAAPADLSGTYHWGLWGTAGTLNNRDFEWFTNSIHNSLGGGFDATQAVIGRIAASTDSQKTSYGITAAHAAGTYSNVMNGVTYDDWYLPSVTELLEMGSLWPTMGLLSETSGTVRYWSSTSYNAPGYSITQMENRAFTVGRNPLNGTLTLDPAAAVAQRIAERRVRPVRRF